CGRRIGAVLTMAVARACGLSSGRRTWWWTAVAAASAIAAVALLFFHVDAAAKCVATYDGHPVLIGREYTPVAAEYIRKSPGMSASDLLLDAGGAAERIWTASS